MFNIDDDLRESFEKEFQPIPKPTIDILRDNVGTLYMAKFNVKLFSPEYHILEVNEEDLRRKIINKTLEKAVFVGESQLIVHCCEGDYGLYIDDPNFTEEFLKFLDGQEIQIKLEIIRKKNKQE